MKAIQRSLLAVAAGLLLWASLAPPASAVPSYTRRYGVECSRCHTMWGSLNAAGVQFRLSGYRAIAGVDMKPDTEDIEISRGLLTIPTTLPLSLITGVGFDQRSEKRTASDGTSYTATGSTVAVEDGSIFLTSPLGKHLSSFIEFPMYETRAWEFTPTGPAQANLKGSHQVQFSTETPVFEVAKFWWNNVLGDDMPRDSVNLLFGITHMPLAYSPGKVRLSVNQYPIYERRALDLISPKTVDDIVAGTSVDADSLFRLSEPQGMFEVNGMFVPHGAVTDVSKRETLWAEYHVGLSNGSNAKADTNNAKDLYGRFVLRWFTQSLGVFAYHSSDTYGDAMRSALHSALAAAGGAGSSSSNSMKRLGLDFTLNAGPLGAPLTLENQLMTNNESNPTGFGTEFKWKGGFDQLNWLASKETVAYARYDWISGDRFDDRARGGTAFAEPKETDYVVGVQHLIGQNIKLVGEFRHHKFEDKASTPSTASLTDDGGTIRIMFGL